MMNLAHSRKNEKRSQICYITSLFRTTLHHNNIIIRKQNSHIKLVFSFINEKRVRFFGNNNKKLSSLPTYVPSSVVLREIDVPRDHVLDPYIINIL